MPSKSTAVNKTSDVEVESAAITLASIQQMTNSRSNSEEISAVPIKVEQDNDPLFNNTDSDNDESNQDEPNFAYQRRVIVPSRYTGTLSRNYRPVPFVIKTAESLPKSNGPSSVDKTVLKVISKIVYIHRLATSQLSESNIRETARQVGYSFPLKSLLSKDDRYEMKLLGSKTIKSNGKREPQVWVYYYPCTTSLSHNVHNEFFGSLFSDENDREYIKDVGDDEETSMICIALHDNLFNSTTGQYETTSNIICGLSFRVLKAAHFSEESGCYVFYLGTLQNVSFHDVVPTNGTMNDMNFDITRNGLAEWLLRTTQVIVYNVGGSYNMFLAANSKTSIRNYYDRLQFEECQGWNVVGEQVYECAKLESTYLSGMLPLKILVPIETTNVTTIDLCCRLIDKFPRPISEMRSSCVPSYRTKMKKVLTAYSKTPLPREVKWNENMQDHFNSTLSTRVSYEPDGPEWAKFHEFWTGKSMCNFWDVKNKFNAPDGDNDCTVGTLFPLEELMMDYVSIGKVITSNVFENNQTYNMSCQLCFKNMTEEPLTHDDVNVCGLAIAQRHFIPINETFLCLADRTEHNELIDRIVSGRIKMVHCKKFITKANYKVFFKAFKQEYTCNGNTSAQMMYHTRQVYRNFITEALQEPMVQNYINRAVCGSFPALEDITTKLSRMNTIKVTNRIKPSKIQQSVVARQVANQTQYKLPENFKEIYADMTKQCTEDKKEDAKKREQQMLSSITGIAVESITDWSKKKTRIVPLRKKQSVTGTQKKKAHSNEKSTKNKEEPSDEDIKLNWKTLMLYSKITWSNGQPPVSKHEIKNESQDYFYIGRSDIKGQKFYFIVSTNIIPHNQNSYIFSNKFLASMGYNTEYDIPLSSVEKLQESVRDAHNYLITKIQPVLIKGLKMWKGKRRNGSHTEPQPVAWIKDSFLPHFKWYFDELMDDQYINEHRDVPSGKSPVAMINDKEHISEEHSTLVPHEYQTNIDVPFCFDNNAYCVFGNMANAMIILGDEMASNFFLHQSS